MPNYLTPGVFVEEIPQYQQSIQAVETSITAFVGYTSQGPVNEPILVKSFAEFERIFREINSGSLLCSAVSDFFTNGGTQAIAVGVCEKNPLEYDAAIIGDAKQKTGMYALDNVTIFNILCLIPSNRSFEFSRDTLVVAAKYCLQKRALLIVDPPPSCTTVAQAEKQAIELSSIMQISAKSVAFYFPRIIKLNTLNNDTIEQYFPSGAIAGIMARIDAHRGVHKAPAGIDADIRGIAGLEKNLTATEIDVLAPLGCNTLRVMSGKPVVWGARTLCANDPEWKYIAVRRLTLFLEESINRGTQWVVFEPNTEALWAKVRHQIETFLIQNWRSGALLGSRPEEAFFVKCDRTTMTQQDIDNGILRILVGFAAMRPAEFLTFRVEYRMR